MNARKLRADLSRVLNSHGLGLDVDDGFWLWRRDYSDGWIIAFSPTTGGRYGVGTSIDNAASIELKEKGATPAREDKDDAREGLPYEPGGENPGWPRPAPQP